MTRRVPPQLINTVRASLAIAVLILSACVPGQRGDAPAAWVDRNEAIAQMPGWTLNGRIGLRLENRGFSGALIWQQDEQAMQVDFRGPLGAGAFRVSGNPEELVLETAKGETFLFDNPEQALESQIGWGIPLPAMRYWLIGLPHPDSAATQTYDPEGRPASLEQLDWLVTYERFGVFDGWEMPQKLVLENTENVRIKLVISRWQLRQQ